MKPFKDELDTAVITTKSVLNGTYPILYIYHYDDGYWQFSDSDENISDADYRVVSLEEIIKIDPSVQAVSNLPYNGKAYRNSKSTDWVIG